MADELTSATKPVASTPYQRATIIVVKTPSNNVSIRVDTTKAEPRIKSM
jgi:hypothetical protein